MPRFDPTSAECLVFVKKAGLFSALGHDLVIRVGIFEIKAEGRPPAIEARLDARSLRVVSAVRGRVPDEHALSAADKATIDAIVRNEILRADRDPTIRFVSSSVSEQRGGYRITGLLTLNGQAHRIHATTTLEAGRQVTEVALHQPDFGIKPYRAALGGLRVEADVVVRLTVPDV